MGPTNSSCRHLGLSLCVLLLASCTTASPFEALDDLAEDLATQLHEDLLAEMRRAGTLKMPIGFAPMREPGQLQATPEEPWQLHLVGLLQGKVLQHGYGIVERRRIDELTTEKTIQLSEIYDSTKRAREGLLEGCKLLVLADVLRSPDSIAIRVWIVDLDTGRQLATAKGAIDGANMPPCFIDLRSEAEVTVGDYVPFCREAFDDLVRAEAARRQITGSHAIHLNGFHLHRVDSPSVWNYVGWYSAWLAIGVLTQWPFGHHHTYELRCSYSVDGSPMKDFDKSLQLDFFDRSFTRFMDLKGWILLCLSGVGIHTPLFAGTDEATFRAAAKSLAALCVGDMPRSHP
jgi:hypothetical protein